MTLKESEATTNKILQARASDLVRIGAYDNVEAARTQYAALRARAMALPNLPKPMNQIQSAAAAKDDNENNDNEDDFKKPPASVTNSKGMTPATTRYGTGSEPSKDQPNPFLLTKEEQKETPVWVHAREKAEEKAEKLLDNKNKGGEGIVDDDMPTEKEWEEMGDSKAW